MRENFTVTSGRHDTNVYLSRCMPIDIDEMEIEIEIERRWSLKIYLSTRESSIQMSFTRFLVF